MSKIVDIVFNNKFLRDIRQANMHIFTEIKGGPQVEVRDVERCKTGATA